ncbi:MAG: argininosuccinate lyase [Gammaproteobacteria bacterium]|nr:argininosuccinate lyase [Gammaproteobacteria bacterium]NNM11376.1 argininosuccinate lyase [Pseudomonadales bacterium]
MSKSNRPEKKSSKAPDSMWGGRFSEAPDAFVERFNASVSFDQRFYAEDIQGSIAHARMLACAGVLSDKEAKQITDALGQIKKQIEAGGFAWSQAREDVHMNIEAALTERIGDVGKKLHTGRSRNDQVATDIRLYLRNRIDDISGLLGQLQMGIVALAEREASTVMPGFTHLQAAQPITFGHHMLAWNEMLERDYARLRDCRARMNLCPLGAAALAGTTYPIDRNMTARELGFDGPTVNSLDSVSDRDFAIEFCAAAGLIMMHLSRMAEELVLWSSQQFDFIDMPDRYCTGSSIMPQKKNPDVPELVRGKSGRVYGHLVALLTLMKSQPLAYNKDNQEDKEPLFDTIDTLRDCLQAFGGLVPALKTRQANMRNAALRGFTTATDLADYLVRKGLPFRDAHEVVGKAVAICLERGVELQDLASSDLQALSPVIDSDAGSVLSLEGSVAARDHIGGTAPKQVLAAASRARSLIEARD